MIEYSLYEAKAKFSEIIRRVRGGGSVVVTYRGEPVAEIRPIQSGPVSLDDRLAELQRLGVLQGAESREGSLTVVERREGALRRFLEERER